MDTSTTSSDKIRSELRDEYFKVVDILQSYDPYFLSIKTWGVSATGAIAAVGFANKAPIVLLLTSIIAGSFWITEMRFKLLQLGHTQRAAELERTLSSNENLSSCPRIMSAFGEQSSRNLKAHRWRSVLFWPQVMFPHVVFVVVGPLAYFTASHLLCAKA